MASLALTPNATVPVALTVLMLVSAVPVILPVQPSRSAVASVSWLGEWCTACVAQNQRTRCALRWYP